MRTAVANLKFSSLSFRRTPARDFAEVLPSNVLAPALVVAGVFVTLFAVLDAIQYWPR